VLAGGYLFLRYHPVSLRRLSARSVKVPIMDPQIARLLNDKLYEKRKTGALEYVELPVTDRTRLC